MTKGKIKIIPEPNYFQPDDGYFIINPHTILVVERELMAVSEFLNDLMFKLYGFRLPIEEFEEKHYKNAIFLRLNSNPSEESYKIGINKESVIISAPNAKGILYAIQSIRQLIPNQKGLKDIKLACGLIEDFPRFRWRGFMLDTARHFFSINTIKKVLDLLVLLKLNIFHWGLTNDQGWRIEIKKYPLLTEIGSKREGTVNERKMISAASKQDIPTDGIPVEGFYTETEIKEILNYASERNITIIPEINFPGHSQAALAAYPNLGCTGGPFKVSTKFGIHRDVLCIGREESIEFVKDILSEVMDLFPSKVIHCGGDEVPTRRWKKCPHCQNMMKKKGYENEGELQEYYTNEIASFLKLNGRRLMGWNEILNDKLEDSAICHYWILNFDEFLKHITQGREVVMSEMKKLYYDYPNKLNTLENTYLYEPIPEDLEEKYQKNVLGIEACLWTEFVKNQDRLEYQAFPRLCAAAEIAWSDKSKKDFNWFKLKLENFKEILNYLEVNYYKASQNAE